MSYYYDSSEEGEVDMVLETCYRCKTCSKVRIESHCKKCGNWRESTCNICGGTGHGTNETQTWCSNGWLKCKDCGYRNHEDRFFYSNRCMNCGTDKFK
jgi:hypothetical protein